LERAVGESRWREPLLERAVGEPFERAVREPSESRRRSVREPSETTPAPTLERVVKMNRMPGSLKTALIIAAHWLPSAGKYSLVSEPPSCVKVGR
jgi:hypothetical protein